MVRNQATLVCTDYENETEEYEGLLYMMFWEDNGKVLPLYIGKAEKYGKNEKNLSANLKGVSNGNNLANFCRWGHNYAYHIGDLSAIVCQGHPEKQKKPKYEAWAKKLFSNRDSRLLSQSVFFWMKAWAKTDSVRHETFGHTKLTFSESLLIGIGSTLYPDEILNTEGVNR